MLAIRQLTVDVLVQLRIAVRGAGRVLPVVSAAFARAFQIGFGAGPKAEREDRAEHERDTVSSFLMARIAALKHTGYDVTLVRDADGWKCELRDSFAATVKFYRGVTPEAALEGRGVGAGTSRRSSSTRSHVRPPPPLPTRGARGMGPGLRGR